MKEALKRTNDWLREHVTKSVLCVETTPSVADAPAKPDELTEE